MNAIVKEKIPQLVELCKKYRVVRMYLFGSAARDDDFDPETSDFDFLFAFDPALTIAEYTNNYFDLMYALDALMGRTVDLVAEETIKSPRIAASINEDKQLIYEEVA